MAGVAQQLNSCNVREHREDFTLHPRHIATISHQGQIVNMVIRREISLKRCHISVTYTPDIIGATLKIIEQKTRVETHGPCGSCIVGNGSRRPIARHRYIGEWMTTG